MIEVNNKKIQNIYYMLTYAFAVLNEKSYRDMALEDFQNTGDMFAEILIRSISILVKRGLGKDYIDQEDALSSPKGKILITESVKQRTMIRSKLICDFDEYSENSYKNQIIKSTVMRLLVEDISKERKKSLRRLMNYFKNVDTIDLYTINWNLRYTRNDKYYQLIIGICSLVVNGLLQTTSNGNHKMMDFLDNQRMSRLYEKFILEYYRKEYAGKITANASQIAWQLDDGFSDMLPKMQSDITLSKGNKVLIIDAKFYDHTTASYQGSNTIISANLYQIFTYVKNKEAELSGTDHEVAGMLLYAKTDAELQPDHDYRMSGNKISVKTLDLNQDFKDISAKLNNIADDYFYNL